MTKRLALLALVAGALAACNENAAEPTPPMPLSAATKVATPLAPSELPTQACPTNSPSAQIGQVLAYIAASNLSEAMKAQITESLQAALTALEGRDLSSAVSALESATALVDNSRAPQPVKDSIVELLTCVLSQLSA